MPAEFGKRHAGEPGHGEEQRRRGQRQPVRNAERRKVADGRRDHENGQQGNRQGMDHEAGPSGREAMAAPERELLVWALLSHGRRKDAVNLVSQEDRERVPRMMFRSLERHSIQAAHRAARVGTPLCSQQQSRVPCLATLQHRLHGMTIERSDDRIFSPTRRTFHIMSRANPRGVPSPRALLRSNRRFTIPMQGSVRKTGAPTRLSIMPRGLSACVFVRH